MKSIGPACEGECWEVPHPTSLKSIVGLDCLLAESSVFTWDPFLMSFARGLHLACVKSRSRVFIKNIDVKREHLHRGVVSSGSALNVISGH